MTSRPLRVLHAPWDVGGHPSSLAAAERRLGLDSRCITLTPSPFGYDGATSLTQPGRPPAVVELARLRLMAKALTWADIVHLNFGATILPADVAPTPGPERFGALGTVARGAYRFGRRVLSGADLALLRAAGTRIIVTFQGDDARPTVNHPGGIPGDPGLDARRARLIGQFDRRASAMFALNPDLLEVLPSRAHFLPYANVDLRVITPSALPSGTVLRVAHAPTSRQVKGTSVVLDAVQRLGDSGVAVELDLIEGVSNAEALRRMAAAHVVVDQLRLGWYGGLAVEAMALGRPVIAFVDERYEQRVPAAMWAEMPVVNVTAKTLERALRSLAEGARADLTLLADQSRVFVERWHDPEHVARQCIDAYTAAMDH